MTFTETPCLSFNRRGEEWELVVSQERLLVQPLTALRTIYEQKKKPTNTNTYLTILAFF